MGAPCVRSVAPPTYGMRFCSCAHCPVGRWQDWSGRWRAGRRCRGCQQRCRPEPALVVPAAWVFDWQHGAESDW